MNLNLRGVDNFFDQISIYSEGFAEPSLPLNVRIVTLPTCAFFNAINSLLDNVSKTILFAIGACISFNASLLVSGSLCAFSAVVDPLALLVLGISSPFLSYTSTHDFTDYINENFNHYRKPIIEFGPITGRVMLILMGVYDIILGPIGRISTLAIEIFHWLGEMTYKVIFEAAIIAIMPVVIPLTVVHGLFSKEFREEEIDKLFGKPSGEIPDNDNEI